MKKVDCFANNDTWICDDCCDVILKEEDARIEWLSKIDGSNNLYGLRLVHDKQQPGRVRHCAYDAELRKQNCKQIAFTDRLSRYLGIDGLVYLLGLICDQVFPVHEVVHMIMRLHVPGYEQANHYFGDAIAEGVFEPNSPTYCYTQEQIQATLKYVADKASKSDQSKI